MALILVFRPHHPTAIHELAVVRVTALLMASPRVTFALCRSRVTPVIETWHIISALVLTPSSYSPSPEALEARVQLPLLLVVLLDNYIPYNEISPVNCIYIFSDLLLYKSCFQITWRS